ncbi:MAG: FxsA family protein [Methyloligellaceae bacterium]
MPILLLIFIVIPLAEIYVFIQVGSLIGTWYTIGLVIITAIIGTSLLRLQGYGVLSRAQSTLNKGDLPVDSVIDGVFLLIAGALLLTPGLITDAIGFLLFVPLLRRAIAKAVFKRFVMMGKDNMKVYTQQDFYEEHTRKKPHNDNIIDADFSEVKDESNKKEPEKTDIDPDSPWKRP